MIKKVAKKGGKVPQLHSESVINYSGSIPQISDKASRILRDIMTKAGVNAVTITSTVRTPEDQARIMYDNIVKHGVAKQKALYGVNGDKVIDVYVSQKSNGKDATAIKKAMTDKINELGSTTISKHCCDPNERSIFDVAPSSVPEEKRSAFIDAIKTNNEIDRYFLPPTDPAYHLEVEL